MRKILSAKNLIRGIHKLLGLGFFKNFEKNIAKSFKPIP